MELRFLVGIALIVAVIALFCCCAMWFAFAFAPPPPLPNTTIQTPTQTTTNVKANANVKTQNPPLKSLPPPWSGRIAVYVLFYDDNSQAAADKMCKAHPLWVRPHKLKQTMLLENILYAETLRQLESEWVGCDFVGTIAAIGGPKKINNFEKLCKAFDAHCDGRVPLVDSTVDSLWLSAVTGAGLDGHPPVFKRAFNDLATDSGMSDMTNKTFKSTWCFCNFWLARPMRMREYITFFSDTWLPQLNAHPLVWSDATYPGEYYDHSGNLKGVNPHPALRPGSVYHELGYFPLHPFLSERAFSLFAMSHQWNSKLWQYGQFAKNSRIVG